MRTLFPAQPFYRALCCYPAEAKTGTKPEGGQAEAKEAVAATATAAAAAAAAAPSGGASGNGKSGKQGEKFKSRQKAGKA